MVVKKPANRWKVVFMTTAVPLPEKKFRSQSAAYLAVNRERDLVRQEASRVVSAVVYEWDMNSSRWMTFERHDLVKEAAQMPPAEESPETGS